MTDCQRVPRLKCLLLRKVGKANLEHSYLGLEYDVTRRSPITAAFSPFAQRPLTDPPLKSQMPNTKSTPEFAPLAPMRSLAPNFVDCSSTNSLVPLSINHFSNFTLSSLNSPFGLLPFRSNSLAPNHSHQFTKFKLYTTQVKKCTNFILQNPTNAGVAFCSQEPRRFYHHLYHPEHGHD